jgi:hypothetical protein
MPSDEKHDILGHKLQYCLDIAGGGGTMPLSDEISDGLFVSVHRNSGYDAQRIKLTGEPRRCSPS